jgi:PDZ domain-containing protein
VRRTLFLAAWIAILAAALIVPLPVVAIAPGAALPVPPRVRIAGPTQPVNGRLLLTTVKLIEPSAVLTVAGWLDDEVDIVSRQVVIPPGVDEREYFTAQQRVFRESAQVAAAVGLRKAGHPVEVSGGGVRVSAVIPGSPAAGKLREGDVIVSVDGRPVRLASEVVETTSRARAGDEVTVEVRRGEETRIFTIRLAQVSEIGRPALGVAISTLGFDIKLPFPVEVDQGRIGGPSAGLMLALTVYDLVDPTDVVRGRTVAGTGTIDVAGRVGPVGGVAQKVEAAEEAGAEMFLVPADEAGEARRTAGKRMKVVSVETMDEAVAALAVSGAPAVIGDGEPPAARSGPAGGP